MEDNDGTTATELLCNRNNKLLPQPSEYPTSEETEAEEQHPSASSSTSSSQEEEEGVVGQAEQVKSGGARQQNTEKGVTGEGNQVAGLQNEVAEQHNKVAGLLHPRMNQKEPKRRSRDSPDTNADSSFYLADSSTTYSLSKCSSSSASSSSSSASINGKDPEKMPPEVDGEAEASAPPTAVSTMAMLWGERPDAKWKVRTLGLMAAILPGVGCYFCLAYTLLFQFHNVANFTIPSSFCPGLKSMFPPISYSIGVWKPQKYIWLMVLSLHMPPRFFYAIVHKNHYSLGQSEFRQRRWFRNITRLHYVLLVAEALGLLAVSVIDIETHFKIHASCFALWLIPFNFNMLFNNILHYHSGIRELKPMHQRVFYAKCALFLVAYPLSVSTAISYLTFVLSCSTFAYATFSVAEYFLVGINSMFYFLLVWEFEGSKVEVYIKHQQQITKNDFQI